MARKKEAVDKEVLEVQEAPAIKTAQEVEPVVPEAPAIKTAQEVEPVVPETPAEPIRMIVPFWVIDKIMDGVEAKKTIEEAIKVDAGMLEAYTKHPHIIARDTRNSYYYLFKNGITPKATVTPDGVWKQPVSYSIA